LFKAVVATTSASPNSIQLGWNMLLPNHFRGSMNELLHCSNVTGKGSALISEPYLFEGKKLCKCVLVGTSTWLLESFDQSRHWGIKVGFLNKRICQHLEMYTCFQSLK
jgi:hypothetical protein